MIMMLICVSENNALGVPWPWAAAGVGEVHGEGQAAISACWAQAETQGTRGTYRGRSMHRTWVLGVESWGVERCPREERMARRP